MSDPVVAALGSQFEALFRQLGIPFEFTPDLSIDNVRLVPEVQVRSQKIAPAERVSRYAEQMKAGAEFPPIIVRKGDTALIDGNTRLRAWQRNERAFIPAYVVSTRNDLQTLELGGACNQLGGKDLDPEELRRVCVKAASHMSAAAVSKIYGVSPSKVNAWTQQDKAVQHAERLGHDPIMTRAFLSGRQQEQLAKIQNDRAFDALLGAIRNSEPVDAELKTLVRSVAESPSEDEAVEAIAQVASAWPARVGSRSSSRSTALSANMHIGALTKHDPDYWVDLAHTGTLIPKWEEIAELAAAVLARLRAA